MPSGSKPGERRGGRKKGTPNKITVQVKEALNKCYKAIGGDKAFAEWARLNRSEYYKLWAKQLPKEMELSGKDGGPIQLAPVEFIEVQEVDGSHRDAADD